MDPAFSVVMLFPLKNEKLVSYFEKLFLENDLELPFIFVLF